LCPWGKRIFSQIPCFTGGGRRDANSIKQAEELAQEFATEATSLKDLNEALRAPMKTALEKMLNTELEVHLGPGSSAAAAIGEPENGSAPVFPSAPQTKGWVQRENDSRRPRKAADRCAARPPGDV
jgi:hypothetical protein